MRPTTAHHDNVIDFEALLHPGTRFEHPRDVLAHKLIVRDVIVERPEHPFTPKMNPAGGGHLLIGIRITQHI